MRCSSSGLSTGDCAPAPGLEASPAPSRCETRVVPEPPCVVLRTPPCGFSALRRLRLLPPRVASQRGVSSDLRAPLRAFSRLPHDCHPKARLPFTRLHGPRFLTFAGDSVCGEGFSESSRLSLSATRPTYGHDPRGCIRARLEPLPLARPRLPDVCPLLPFGSTTLADHGNRAGGSAPRDVRRSADSPSAASSEFPRNPPRYVHGPTVLK